MKSVNQSHATRKFSQFPLKCIFSTLIGQRHTAELDHPCVRVLIEHVAKIGNTLVSIRESSFSVIP